MKHKKAIDRALRLKGQEEVRKKNITDYFVNFSKPHIEWLRRLSADYKERNDFGIHPFILADYYKKPEDREIALFASLLVSENDNIRKQVDHLRRLISDEPYKWFSNREFVSISMGRNQNKRIDGSSVFFWQLSRLFERIYDICQQEGNMETAVMQTMKLNNSTAFGAMTYYLQNLVGLGSPWWRLNFLLIRLFRPDGLGMGLWGKGDEPLLCPYNSGVKEFIQTWFPDYRRVGSSFECIKYFGFDDDVDFFYAYLGYKELQRRKPNECGYYATRYQSWYECSFKAKPYRWREIMPEI